MSHSPNLQSYFSRINYSGPTTPTLATLSAIVFAHVTSVPFENLSVLLGHPIRIEREHLEEKIIHQRRGGYCFEQNSLLLHVLTDLGFHVTPLSGRVRFKAPRDFTPPRTHLFLKVLIDGTNYLADVGVGGLSPSCPLLFDTDAEQPTPHEPRRLVRENGRIYHQVRIAPGDSPQAWADVVEFTGEEMPFIDREIANYWTSTHPNSKFKQNLTIALANPDGTRHTLQNHELTHRRGAQVLSTQAITTPQAMRETLAETFRLSIPPATVLKAANLNWPPVS